MMAIKTNSALLVLALLLACVSSAYADPIALGDDVLKVGVNFKSNGDEYIDAAETAGVVPQRNWKNVFEISGSAKNVPDSTGARTTIDVFWTSPGLGRHDWDMGDPDDSLMHGYLDSFKPKGGDEAVVTVSDVLGTTESPFDVYVYFDGNGTEDREGAFTIGDTTYYAKDLAGHNWDGPDGGPFVQVTSTDPDNPGVGNYVVFRDVLGDFVLTTHSIGKDSGPGTGLPINGMQIVPEPATVVMLLSGLLVPALLLLLRRRRSR